MGVNHDAAHEIVNGTTSLGIELGSTRIKAALINSKASVLATGGFDWENQWVDGMWTYSLDAVWEGLRCAFSELSVDVRNKYEVELTQVGSIGISGMMHGYLAFDEDSNLLVPFRTWRNTTTAQASAELTKLFSFNIPLRWSVAHLYQAILNGEEHVSRISHITTLAGLVHWKLTGEKILGIGDASGMFPIDSTTGRFDANRLAVFNDLIADHGFGWTLDQVLPTVASAGACAGNLTPEGAALLDPSGALRPGAPCCPPEGDAGTGMVATNSIAPRTGNISAGTSIFAMVVLEKDPDTVHEEIDVVTTPAGSSVAMVHCNNGASELGAWAGVFQQFAEAAGVPMNSKDVYQALFSSAMAGEADGGGLLAYNYLAGEPITGLDSGRPLFVRTPGSELSLANFMRTQLYSAFATLALGMRTLAEDEVGVDRMFAHGGVFATKGVAQKLLAAAIGAPVSVGDTASEGGAWGMAVLAEYARVRAPGQTLADYLDRVVFASENSETVTPDPVDAAGFAAFLTRYSAGLAIEHAAVLAMAEEM